MTGWAARPTGPGRAVWRAPVVLLVAVGWLAGCGVGTDEEPVPIPSEITETTTPDSED